MEILEIAVKFIRKMKTKMSDDTAMNRAGKDTGKLPSMIIHQINEIFIEIALQKLVYARRSSRLTPRVMRNA